VSPPTGLALSLLTLPRASAPGLGSFAPPGLVHASAIAAERTQHPIGLEIKSRQQGRRIFDTGFLLSYRNRSEVLRAETNGDLIRLIAGHEDQDAARFATSLIAKGPKDAKL
jgi:hypothetical protein